MSDFRDAFIDFAIAKGVLKFGQFTLKSGRISPYFFNAGLFQNGGDLAQLGRFYARAIIQSGVEFDMIFGPAYKGIPLATATAIALSEHHQIDKPYCFNRKEIKSHGEGGHLVGAPLMGRVLIVDDVITAGTAIRESVAIIEEAGAQASAVCIALDRQETGREDRSAIEEVKEMFRLEVLSICNLDQLIRHLSQTGEKEEILQAMTAYREQYGV